MKLTEIAVPVLSFGIPWWLKKRAAAAEAKPLPPGQPPRVPPAQPPVVIIPPLPQPPPAEPPPVRPPIRELVWGAPRFLPDLGRSLVWPDPNVHFEVPQQINEVVLSLSGPAAAPAWMLYATIEIAGGMVWPLQSTDVSWLPMGFHWRRAVDSITVTGALVTDEFLARIRNDIGVNIAMGGVLLNYYMGRARTLMLQNQMGGGADDLSHIVRLAWLDGGGAFDLLRQPQFRGDAPAWYVERRGNALSQAEAWDIATKRWGFQQWADAFNRGRG